MLEPEASLTWYTILHVSKPLYICVCLCIWSEGPSSPQIIQDVYDPERGLDSWAGRLRVFKGKRGSRSA